MAGIYIAPLSKVLYNWCFSFTHKDTLTHQWRLAAMQGPKQLVRSNWGLGVLLKDTLTHPGWDRTGNPQIIPANYSLLILIYFVVCGIHFSLHGFSKQQKDIPQKMNKVDRKTHLHTNTQTHTGYFRRKGWLWLWIYLHLPAYSIHHMWSQHCLITFYFRTRICQHTSSNQLLHFPQCERQSVTENGVLHPTPTVWIQPLKGCASAQHCNTEGNTE